MFWTADAQFRKWLPQLQAHRGYWVGGLPQNSLAAIQKAFELGYQMVEFDVRLTLDNQIVLFHDDYIRGAAIDTMTFQNLYNLHPVNTLRELLHWFSDQPDKNIKLNIELKTKQVFLNRLEVAVSKLLNEFTLTEQIIITSFNPFALSRMRVLQPKIYRGLIQTLEDYPENRWLIKKRFFNLLAKPHALHLRLNDWKLENFKKVIDRVPVVLWTHNDLEAYQQIAHEVHGVISDKITPAMLQAKT